MAKHMFAHSNRLCTLCATVVFCIQRLLWWRQLWWISPHWKHWKCKMMLKIQEYFAEASNQILLFCLIHWLMITPTIHLLFIFFHFLWTVESQCPMGYGGLATAGKEHAFHRAKTKHGTLKFRLDAFTSITSESTFWWWIRRQNLLIDEEKWLAFHSIQLIAALLLFTIKAIG